MGWLGAKHVIRGLGYAPESRRPALCSEDVLHNVVKCPCVTVSRVFIEKDCLETGGGLGRIDSRPKSATACSCVCFQVVPCHGVHWPTTACRDVCKFTRVTCISHAHAAVPSPGGRVTRPSLRVSSRNWVSTDGTRDRSARDVCLQRWDYCNSLCWRHAETTNAMRETMLWWSRVCTRVPITRVPVRNTGNA